MNVSVDVASMLTSFKNAAADDDLTLSEMLVLAAVALHSDVRQADILKAVDLGFTRQNLSRVVKKLVDKGLVDYDLPDPEQPKKVLNATLKGAELVDSWTEAVRESLEVSW